MNKTIARTAVITALVTVVASVLVFLSLLAFAPRYLSSRAYKLGMDDFSFYLLEKAYKQSSSTEDLAEVSARACLDGRSEKIIEYVSLLVDREDFSSVCAKMDENSTSSASGGTADYIVGCYVDCLYIGGNAITALNVAFKSVLTDYRNYNPVQRLINSAFENHDKKVLSEILVELKKLDYESTLKASDIQELETYLNE